MAAIEAVEESVVIRLVVESCAFLIAGCIIALEMWRVQESANACMKYVPVWVLDAGASPVWVLDADDRVVAVALVGGTLGVAFQVENVAVIGAYRCCLRSWRRPRLGDRGVHWSRVCRRRRAGAAVGLACHEPVTCRGFFWRCSMCVYPLVEQSLELLDGGSGEVLQLYHHISVRSASVPVGSPYLESALSLLSFKVFHMFCLHSHVFIVTQGSFVCERISLIWSWTWELGKHLSKLFSFFHLATVVD